MCTFTRELRLLPGAEKPADRQQKRTSKRPEYLPERIGWMRKATQSTDHQEQKPAGYLRQYWREGQAGESPELSLQVKMTRLGGKVLEMKKCTKSFGQFPILAGFDYTFKKGNGSALWERTVLVNRRSSRSRCNWNSPTAERLIMEKPLFSVFRAGRFGV